jgi:hypothetical protein
MQAWGEAVELLENLHTRTIGDLNPDWAPLLKQLHNQTVLRGPVD